MIYPALTSQIAKHVNRRIAQKTDTENSFTHFAIDPRNETYRKDALKEIKKALRTSMEF